MSTSFSLSTSVPPQVTGSSSIIHDLASSLHSDAQLITYISAIKARRYTTAVVSMLEHLRVLTNLVLEQRSDISYLTAQLVTLQVSVKDLENKIKLGESRNSNGVF